MKHDLTSAGEQTVASLPFLSNFLSKEHNLKLIYTILYYFYFCDLLKWIFEYY